MTPAQFLLFTRTHARIAALRPEMIAALYKAYTIIADSFSESEITDIIQSGNLDRLVTEALTDAVFARAFIPIRERMRETMRAGFRYATPSLPGAGKIDGTLAVAFDHLSPNVVTAIQKLDTAVLTNLKTETRAVVRAAVEEGIKLGQGPRTTARSLRSVIGLGPTQMKEVENFRDALLGQNGRSVADYTLRDKRVDRMLAKGPLTPQQVERYTEAYRKRRIALNAETTARTATLDAFKAGQRLSWQNAIDSGIVDGGNLMHQWIGVMDLRERPEHIAMEKETVPFDQPYSNGELVPGSDTYNCRCLDRFFVERSVA
jgi:hypothetical protein